jgi:lysophospholipase L1-like esterase
VHTRRRKPQRIRTGVLALAVSAAAALAGCGSPGSGSADPSAPVPHPAPVWDRSPGSVAAVGDSITRGFDACGVLVDCPAVSWSTGTDASVRSLAARLIGDPSVAERSWNDARSGARMADLVDQMTRAAAHHPDLVTVMVGANDACRKTTKSMTTVKRFRSSFVEAMRLLRAKSPKTQVYVSSVPDLKRLWSTGRGNPLGREIWKLGLCASMLGNAQDNSAGARKRRQKVYDRVVAYNGVLKDVCARDRLCRYDGGAVFDFRFTGAQLSQWDWFHPSTSGQGRLAEIAYRNVVAAKPPA